MSDDEQFHQIGAVADRVGLSLRTIRHYEEVGLVIPSGRSTGGFRLYSDDDIDRLEQVKVMKPLGFSLEETAELLESRAAATHGTATSDQLDRLDEFATRAEATCEVLAHRLELARGFTRSLRDELAAVSA